MKRVHSLPRSCEPSPWAWFEGNLAKLHPLAAYLFLDCELQVAISHRPSRLW